MCNIIIKVIDLIKGYYIDFGILEYFLFVRKLVVKLCDMRSSVSHENLIACSFRHICSLTVASKPHALFSTYI